MARRAAIHMAGDWIETTPQKAWRLEAAGALKFQPGWSNDFVDEEPTDYYDVIDADVFAKHEHILASEAA